jgi:hypothetical protein
VSEYIPLAAELAINISGDLMLETNEFGPDQLYEFIPSVELKLSVWPAQTGELEFILVTAP